MPTFSLRGCDINQKGLVRGQDGTLAIIATNGATNATVQGKAQPGNTWMTAVVTVYRANSYQGPFVALSTPLTLTAAGITAESDISGSSYLALSATTAEGSTSLADFDVFMNDRNA